MITAKFKDSPLGPIPQDWEVKRLGEIAPLQRGFDLPTSLLCKGEYPVVYSNGICNYHNEAMCNAPGLITGRSGTIGKFTFIATGKYWPHNTTLWVTNFNGNDPQFIYWMYSFIGFERFATGSGVPTLNRNAIHEYWAACPPLPEQRRIAEALGKMDRLIELLDAQIVKKRRIAQGLAHDLLGMRNEECGMRNKPIRRLPGFKGEWVKKRLGDIGKFYGGLSGKTASDFGKGNAHYITFLNVLNNTIIDDTEVGVVDIRNGEKQNQVKKGDLFFNVSSETVEEVAMCSALLTDMPDTYLNSFCCGFRLTDAENDPLFISYFFNGEQGRETVKGFANGITRYNMSKKAFYDAVVCWPSLAEQRAIAEVLAAADAEIAALETKRQKYIRIKDGVMRNLLSGRVRVNAECGMGNEE